MEIICIFFITMPSIGVFAMPTSERDLGFETSTSMEPLKALIDELDNQIDSLRLSNDVGSLNTSRTLADLKFKMELMYGDQQAEMVAYKTDVSFAYFLVGFCIFCICLSIELMLGLPFREDNRAMNWKITFVLLPVVSIIFLYWLVTAIHRWHFPQFYQM